MIVTGRLPEKVHSVSRERDLVFETEESTRENDDVVLCHVIKQLFGFFIYLIPILLILPFLSFIF
ncbi:hypothetical protein HanHA300_Chr06g0200811 [Helianthus annuus]|nr:hypothetical protein HanHA300_Chr06g0200811 [Helianthus annuus]